MAQKTIASPGNQEQFTASVFFGLLVEAIKNKRRSRDNYKADKNKLTQTQLFYDLDVLIRNNNESVGEFKYLYRENTLDQSYKNAASKFKTEGELGKNSSLFCINDGGAVEKFDDRIKSNYTAVYTQAVTLARMYFGNACSDENDTLIQKVLFLIRNDSSIKDDQAFLICSDGSTKTKADLVGIDEIEFEAFLLGVWHFLIVSQRLRSDLKDKNKLFEDFVYTEHSINLVFSDIEITPTVTSGDSDTQNPTDINDKCKENDVSEEQSTEETRSIREKAAGHVASEFETQVDERDFNTISVLENNEIRLSRSIYFYLMENCRQTVHPKRDKNAVERLFLDLLHLTGCDNCSLKPDRGLTRYYPDKFRQLKMRSSAYCLDDESLINSFSEKLLEDYDAVLSDMIKIRKKYFNSDEKNENLVVALIEFIRNDNSIDNRQEFLVRSDGTALTKAQLCEVEEIEFEPFLLGVWHYVLTQYRAKDSADEKTYETVFRTGYKPPDEDSVLYRTADLIAEQSELYVELIYIEE